MNPLLDPQTNQLRSGWRALFFLLISPLSVALLSTFASRETAENVSIGFNAPTLVMYCIQIIWLLIAAWLCLRFLENMRLGALGFGFFRGWMREIFLGFAIAAAMITAVTILQIIGGGTRLMLNPLFWHTVAGTRAIDWTGVTIIARSFCGGLLLFSVAAATEELLFRGYAFQTLLRGGVAPVVPIFLLSLFFGLGHARNPNSTFFSIVNTVLAGVWLAVAYLKTRSLWFPTALHLGWNWMLGVFFGLPVSGMKMMRAPVFISSSAAPLWLTGGAYGSEGGAAATIILLVATIFIWRTKWLDVAPEMAAALRAPEKKVAEKISLGLAE